MNRKWLGFLSVIMVLSLASCLKDLEMKTARAGNKFLIDLPKAMSPSTTLRPGADLQYTGSKSFPLNFYALTDEKSSQKTMGINFTTEEIYYLETEQIASTGQDVKISIPKSSSIQYLSCVYGEVHMKSNGQEQLFRIYVCEGGSRFYRLVIFGQADVMQKEKKAVNDIFESFREWTEFQAKAIEG